MRRVRAAPRWTAATILGRCCPDAGLSAFPGTRPLRNSGRWGQGGRLAAGGVGPSRTIAVAGWAIGRIGFLYIGHACIAGWTRVRVRRIPASPRAHPAETCRGPCGTSYPGGSHRGTLPGLGALRIPKFRLRIAAGTDVKVPSYIMVLENKGKVRGPHQHAT